MIRIVLWALLILLIIFLGFLVNRMAFDAMMSRGELCNSSTPAWPSDSKQRVFTTDNLCWASGIRLEQGKRYCITLTIVDDWLDRTERADVGGFRTNTLVHFNALLLRRRWGENWFKPIAKIGSTGREEHVLTSIPALPSMNYKAPADVPGSRFEKIPATSAAAIVENDPTPPDRKKLAAELTPRNSGELFLFVNDAVLGIRRYAGLFYQNNRGSARVDVTDLPEGQTCK
jgi:hypothetical protein